MTWAHIMIPLAALATIGLGVAAGAHRAPAAHCAADRAGVQLEIYGDGAQNACLELLRAGWRPAEPGEGYIVCRQSLDAATAVLVRDADPHDGYAWELCRS